jgi:hypothetical protein
MLRKDEVALERREGPQSMQRDMPEVASQVSQHPSVTSEHSVR